LRDKGEKKGKRKFSVISLKNIQDIPIHLLRRIISHTYEITDKKHILSLRQVCRNWNLAISRLMCNEITRLFTKYSPEITLRMRCQTHIGEITNFDLQLQHNGLNNKCGIEFLPRVNNSLYVDHYIFLDFFLFINYNDNNEKKILRKEKEISRFIMSHGNFDNSFVNPDDLMIDLDLAFQYIPHEPMTFRTKAISFSPIYVLDWFNNK
jgi:hypothetical protein